MVARGGQGDWAEPSLACDACPAPGLTMVTANARESDRVPGLAVEVWREIG